MYGRSEGRRRLAESLSAAQDADTPQLDEFERGVASALQRRGIVSVPGLQSREELDHLAYKARVAAVIQALTPVPAIPEPEPEVRQSLPDQLKALIAQQYGAESLPLNGPRLTEHVVRQLQNPGGRSAQAGQSASGSDTT